MGRSRGGLTTKIHALVDAEGRPVALTLTAGQNHDSTVAEQMLSDLKPGASGRLPISLNAYSRRPIAKWSFDRQLQRIGEPTSAEAQPK